MIQSNPLTGNIVILILLRPIDLRTWFHLRNYSIGWSYTKFHTIKHPRDTNNDNIWNA